MFNHERSLTKTLLALSQAKKFNAWMFSQYGNFISWGKIWEIGSGHGSMSEFYADASLLCVSEYNADYLEQLKRKFEATKNVKIEQVDLNQLDAQYYSKFQFNTIVSTNVLEHIGDDRAALNAISKTMHRHTILITLVPAHQILFSIADHELGHFRRYSKHELANKLKDAGHEILEIKYFNRLGALGWFIKFKVLKINRISENDIHKVEAYLPIFKLFDLIPLPFGQSLVAISKLK